MVSASDIVGCALKVHFGLLGEVSHQEGTVRDLRVVLMYGVHQPECEDFVRVVALLPGAPRLQETATPQDSTVSLCLQGYLADKRTPNPLGPPRHGPAAGSCGGYVSHQRGTPVWPYGAPSRVVFFFS